MLKSADCPVTPKYIQYGYRVGVAFNINWFLTGKKKIDLNKIYDEDWNKRVMDRFFNKEMVVFIATISAIMAFGMMIQSNYFATKLDLANLKLEMAEMHVKLKEYSDNQDKTILQNLDNKYNLILKEIRSR